MSYSLQLPAAQPHVISHSHHMARFILCTDEDHERQHRFISHFYPEAVRTNRSNGVVVWTQIGRKGKRQDRIVGKSEAHKDNKNIFLFSIHLEFLTIPLSSPTIYEIIHSLQFRIVSNKHRDSLT
jgi:hypothetical protein